MHRTGHTALELGVDDGLLLLSIDIVHLEHILVKALQLYKRWIQEAGAFQFALLLCLGELDQLIFGKKVIGRHHAHQQEYHADDDEHRDH